MVGLNIHSPWPAVRALPRLLAATSPVVPRPRHPAARAPWPWAPRPLPWLPPCPVNEWMNGPGTTATAAQATRTPRKQIACRGPIRPVYFVFEMQRSFRGDYAQSSWNWTRGRRKTGYNKIIYFFLAIGHVWLVIELLTRELGLCQRYYMRADGTGDGGDMSPSDS